MDLSDEPVLKEEIEVSFGIDGYRFYKGYRDEFDAGGVPAEIFLTLIIVKGNQKSICSNMEGCIHLQNTDQVLEFVRLLSNPRTWFLFHSPGIEISHFINEEKVLEDSEWEAIYRSCIKEGLTEEEALDDCLDLISRSKFEELKPLGLFDVRVNFLEDSSNDFSVKRCVCVDKKTILRIRETVHSNGHYSYEILDEIKPEAYRVEFPRYE